MLFELFKVFFKIGSFSFGGGFAMIPMFQKELVDNKKWIEEEEFLDIIAVSQSSPGPIVINMGVLIGYKLGGLKGAIVCALGTLLAPFIVIILAATVFFQYRDNHVVGKIFLGIRPAIVGLIVSAVYRLGRQSKFGYKKYMISILTALLIVLFNISPIYLILIGGISSIIYYKNKKEKSVDSLL